MKIAISTDGDLVSEHFGRCPVFTIVELENCKITKKELVRNPAVDSGHQPGLVPKFLHEQKVDCIVCGGMGPRAINFFKEFGIQTIIGVQGKIDEVLKKLERGSLEGGESLCTGGGHHSGGECGHHHEKDECEP